MRPPRKLGVVTGMGLVITNTIGSGIFLGTGFMLQEMEPPFILAAWAVGALLAGSGAVAYAALSRRVLRSGGEYRYLSDLVHPALGYVAGWASLFMGFAAPVAIDLGAAGEYLALSIPWMDARLFATAAIVALTALHAFGVHWARWTQAALALFKVVLLLGVVALALQVTGPRAPSWLAPAAAHPVPWRAFLENQLWIAFAFSGWNAAVYAAGEFRDPSRDVPRATLAGWALIAVLYLLVNWAFLVVLSPEQAAGVLDHDRTRVTLGHIVARDLLGEAGAAAASLAFVAVFVGGASAMIFAGPRVVAAMAEDGWLPRFLASREGRPPVSAVLLQGAIAMVFLYTHSLRDAVQGAASVLLGMAALSAAAVLRLPDEELPLHPRLVRAAAAFYAAGGGVILALACVSLPKVALSLALFVLLGVGGWLAQGAAQQRLGARTLAAPTAATRSAAPTE